MQWGCDGGPSQAAWKHGGISGAFRGMLGWGDSGLCRLYLHPIECGVQASCHFRGEAQWLLGAHLRPMLCGV